MDASPVNDARGLGKRVARRKFRVFERLALERIVHLAQRLAERRVAEFAQPRVMPDRRGRQHGLREHDAFAAGAELDLAQQAGVVVDLEPFAQRSRERGFTQPAKPPKSHRRTAQRTDARGEHSRLGEPGQQVVRHARRDGGERRPVRGVGQEPAACQNWSAVSAMIELLPARTATP